VTRRSGSPRRGRGPVVKAFKNISIDKPPKIRGLRFSAASEGDAHRGTHGIGRYADGSQGETQTSSVYADLRQAATSLAQFVTVRCSASTPSGPATGQTTLAAASPGDARCRHGAAIAKLEQHARYRRGDAAWTEPPAHLRGTGAGLDPWRPPAGNLRVDHGPSKRVIDRRLAWAIRHATSCPRGRLLPRKRKAATIRAAYPSMTRVGRETWLGALTA